MFALSSAAAKAAPAPTSLLPALALALRPTSATGAFFSFLAKASVPALALDLEVWKMPQCDLLVSS